MRKAFIKCLVPETITLDRALQKMLDFIGFDDYGHLFNITYKKYTIESPMSKQFKSSDEDGVKRYADELVSSFGFQKGDSMQFNFDYGACWVFGLKVDDVTVSSNTSVCNLGKKGRFPKQY